ncbi:translation elongation factor Ts [Aerococcus kribbianus]|uniref:Elongation factor Ts n=1 Tax=Aerococcus kribbianus TaxID=2999064 RepID=A0A9X3FLN3_9LACT|nr:MULTISPECIES: translation elongation factor Ts [unclassified Aerococcus]MCZ0716760.1 translation elongation factor Ts [Aerococcus sp. YH-aer221]MCZ0725048.1 translation elongation factor Ts [Aerococcus sp. YH-aer222]
MAVTAKQVKELRDRTGVGMMDAKKALVAVEGDMDKAVDYLRENGLAKADKKADRIAAEGLTKVVVDGNDAAIVEVNSETDFVAKNDKFIEVLNKVAENILANKPADLDAALSIDVDGESLADYLREATSVIGEKISLRRFETVTKSDDQSFGTYVHQGGRISVLTLVEGSDQSVAEQVAMHVGGMKPRFLNEEDVPADVREHEKEVLTEQALKEGKPANIVEKMIEGRLKKFFAEICLVDQKFLLDDSQTVSEFAAAHDSKVLSFVRYEVGEGMQKREENFADEVASQMGK